MNASIGILGPAAAGAAAVILAYMTAWFIAAVLARRNDLADVAWGLGFVTVALWLLTRSDAPRDARQYLATTLVVVWGVRLAWHIGRRNLRPGRGEDERYAAWRRSWGRWFVLRSYVQVFALQGAFMWLISMPLIVVGSVAGPRFGPIDWLGLGVWALGLFFECVGDAQLARFLRDPDNRGHVMDRGLWSWSRHPNYFGESTMWWGLGIVALSVPGGWVGLVGPITITLLLVKVSGIPMLERKRAGQPEWEAYKARTSAFIPLPPKR